MPRIADLRLPPGPREDPLSYPGDALAFSYLWVDSWVYPLRPTAGHRLGQWPVDLDGGPLADGSPDASGESPPVLLDALRLAGATAARDRYPVLAFGSNASPAQLLDKFGGDEPRQRVLPVTRGSVRGLRLSHSPHVSMPGYVPYVVVAGGSDLDVCVLWPDAPQLARLNGTEPNYELVPMPGDRFALSLESGEPVAAYSVYRGRWGALRRPGGHRPVVAGTQHEVFAGLLQMPWFRDLVGADGPGGDAGTVVGRLREDPALRESARLELIRRHLTTADGWGAPPAGR